MAVITGSKYEVTKAILKSLIGQNAVSVLEMEAMNHVCYFCLKRIDGKLHVVIVEEKAGEKQSESMYFLDNYCYENTKRSYIN